MIFILAFYLFLFLFLIGCSKDTAVMGIYIVTRSGGVVQQYSTPSACYLPRVMDHYFKEQINGSWNWMDVPGHDYLWLNMFFVTLNNYSLN